MNLPQRWRKRKPRRPLGSPLPPLRRSPRRWPLKLRCPKPTSLKVSALLRSKCLRRVVVVAVLTNTLVILLTGAEAEGSDIPSAVPVAPGTQEAAVEAPEPMEMAAGEAAATTRGGGDDALPEPALEVVVRSPEIQDAEPIRSAPMTEAATSSHGGIELLADDLIDPTTVARHLGAVRQAEQWMKVSSHNPLSSQSFCIEYPSDVCCLHRTSLRGPA
jgi:hypothetical protein